MRPSGQRQRPDIASATRCSFRIGTIRLLRRVTRPYNSLFGEITKYDGPMNEVFQALGDPTRREVLRLLRQGDLTAGEIAERFPLAKSTLSGHFNVLKHAGLIVSERRGTTIVYSLNASAFEEALAAVLELFDVGARAKEPSK
jgi:DNA-binding transcriptional ArsR family regulator